MLSDFTEFDECWACDTPLGKLALDGFCNEFKFREVAVMKAQAANQFPNPLDRVKVWAIGWEKEQLEIGLLGLTPLSVHTRMVESGIIHDDHNAPSRTTGNPSELVIERPGRLGIKLLGLLNRHEFAVTKAHRAEIADRFTRRMVEQNRILDLGWNPHEATGAMLLEVHFIDSPQINTRIFRQFTEFFYKQPAVPCPHEQSRGVVCAIETPFAGKDAGTAAPARPTRTLESKTRTMSCRPIRRRISFRPRQVFGATPSLSSPFASRSNGWGGQSARPRLARKTPASQTFSPSTRPCEAHLPVGAPLRDRLRPGQLRALHATGGRIAIPRCGGSRLAVPVSCSHDQKLLKLS